MSELILAFSGGKDSTAAVLRCAELGLKFRLLYTPTGNELPSVREHISHVQGVVGMPLVDINSPSLEQLIEEQRCLPNFRMRFCTRMIKIEPVLDWLRHNGEDVVMAIGLRADEEGRLGGDYPCEVWHPLREWGWGIKEVLEYNACRGVAVPERTDCAVCYYQTLSEWHSLWENYPEEYAKGEEWETRIGHTFRSPQRDSHPAALVDLRKEFEAGYKPTKRKRKIMCRVCQ